MVRSRVVVASMCTLVLGCGTNLGGPLRVRPIVRVDALDVGTGQATSSIRVGETTRLMLMVYSAGASLDDPGAIWKSRDASIASNANAGSVVLGRLVGTTYVVGEIADDDGSVFRDSVRVTVTP